MAQHLFDGASDVSTQHPPECHRGRRRGPTVCRLPCRRDPGGCVMDALIVLVLILALNIMQWQDRQKGVPR